MKMLPDSEEYAQARELCRKLSGGEVPSGLGDQIALLGAVAIKLPAALDTIEVLVRVNTDLRSGLKLATATVAETRAQLGSESA